jgi:hypothetical protein
MPKANPNRPMFTKWRKNKGQFKRKKNFHQRRKEVSYG